MRWLTRIAGCLITVFGQPARRIVSLSLSDVDTGGPTVRLRLARDWLTVPEPLATLVIKHAADRANTNTAANAASSWLFSGGMPGEHLDRNHLLTALRSAGVPALAARNATWQHLVRQAPPQVLADALGISPATAMRHAGQAGSDWARYAATSSQAHHQEG